MTARDAVQVRVATLADGEALARLLGEMGYPVEQGATEERLRMLIADPANHLVMVATVGIMVAGVIAGHLIPLLQQEAPLGRITALAVDEGLIEKLGLARHSVKKSPPLVAPMPGLVVKVLAQPAMFIETGDPLIVFEAMKMENVLKLHSLVSSKRLK